MAIAHDKEECAEQMQVHVDVTQRTSWKLVWCYEHCHKEECSSQRRALAAASQKHCASFVPVKKAAKLGYWIAKQCRAPYVLVTDWRELKPCLDMFKQHDNTNHPSFTVVVCAHPRSFEKASQWARRISPCRLHVCKSVDSVEKIISALAQHFAGVDVELPVGRFQEVMNPELVPTVTQTHSRGVPLGVQPLGLQGCNKAQASEIASLGSAGKSKTFGILEHCCVSPQQSVEDEGNCEVSRLVGTLSTLATFEMPWTMPRKASEDSFPEVSDTGRQTEKMISSLCEVHELPVFWLKTPDDFVIERSSQVSLFYGPPEADMMQKAPARGSMKQAHSQHAGFRQVSVPLPSFLLPGMRNKAESDDCTSERMELIAKMLREAMPDHYEE